MCSWSYLLLKTTVDYVMKKHINNNYHVLNITNSDKFQDDSSYIIIDLIYVIHIFK
jgi:hypothetical protein